MYLGGIASTVYDLGLPHTKNCPDVSQPCPLWPLEAPCGPLWEQSDDTCPQLSQLSVDAVTSSGTVTAVEVSGLGES